MMIENFKELTQKNFTQNTVKDFCDKLEAVDQFLDVLKPDDLSKNDVEIFIHCMEIILNDTVQHITDKELLFPNEIEDTTNSLDHRKIHLLLRLLSSIVTKSVNLLSSYDVDGLFTESFRNVCAPSLVKLCLVFDDETSWSRLEDVKHVKNISNAIFQVLLNSSLQEFLITIHNPIYVTILKLVISTLNRDQWKRYPATVHAFRKLICFSNGSKLISSLQVILPIILRLSDDYNPRFVLTGLKMLEQLLSLIPAAEFRIYGWDEVIYDALVKKLYLRKVPILDICLPCLLSVLKILQRDPKKADKPRSLTKYDEAIQIIMSNLTMCTENEVVTVLWKYFPSYVQAMGITTSRHLKDIMQLFEQYLMMGNPVVLPYVLQAIVSVTNVAWNRVKRYTPMLLKQLLLLAQRLYQQNYKNTSLYTAIRSCIVVLYQCNAAVVTGTLMRLRQLRPWNSSPLQEVVGNPESRL